MENTNEELIKKMYGANLESQKQQLTQSHNAGNSALDEAKKQNQAAADANLNRTAVEAQKKAIADAEIQNAYGLSSGAAAQARLARDNQTAADMAAIRAAQQEADAQVERERALLSQEYTSAIQKAQADNDLELAKALYENAQAEEQKLLAKKEAAANAMAGVGDYSLFGQLYGLSSEETGKLTAAFQNAQNAKNAEAENARFKQELEAAKYIAEQTGDQSYVDAVYAKYLGGMYAEKVSTDNYNRIYKEISAGYTPTRAAELADEIVALSEKGLMSEADAMALMDILNKKGDNTGGTGGTGGTTGTGAGANNSQVGTPYSSRTNPGTHMGGISQIYK